MATRTDLLQGTLDLLILKTLRLGSLHGWGISKRVRELSNDVLQINQGSLYPALYRLEERGLIESSWGTSPEGRKAKFYEIESNNSIGPATGATADPGRSLRHAKISARNLLAITV